MVVTNKLGTLATKLATRVARFEDFDSSCPLPEIFGDRQNYDEWRENMYFMIIERYKVANELINRGKCISKTAEGDRIALGVIEDIQQIRDQLNGHYAEFREGLIKYAERVLGAVKASDLMEGLKNAESILPAVDPTAYRAELKEKAGRIGEELSGKRSSYVNCVDEGRLKTDYGNKAEERLNQFFSGD